MATDCDALMAKLNAIDSRLSAMESKFILKSDRNGIISEAVEKAVKDAVNKVKALLNNFIPKSDRGSIVNEGGEKGKNITMPLVTALLGSYATKAALDSTRNELERLFRGVDIKADQAKDAASQARIEAEKKISRAELDTAKAQLEQDYRAGIKSGDEQTKNYAESRVNKAKYEVEQSFNQKLNPVKNLAEAADAAADAARGIADQAQNTAKEAKGLYGQLNSKFENFQSSIAKKIDDVAGKAGQAFNKAAKAIGISDDALKASQKALGVAFDALGKIATILAVIDIVFNILNSLDLRTRLRLLEERIGYIERDVSKILGMLFGIKNDVDTLKSAYPKISEIANKALSIANAVSGQMQSIRNTADMALTRAITSGVAAAAASTLAGNALTRTMTPGPRGLPGLAGKDGKDGKNGLPGKDGKNGLPGLAGRNGLDGRPGRDGKNGINGKDGLPGKPITVVQQRVFRPVQNVYNNIRNQTTIVQTSPTAAIDSALLKKIDATTTANLAATTGIRGYLGTMQAFAQKAWETTRLQKVIDVLTLATSLHNAYYLSQDVAATMGEMLTLVLETVGMKDEAGNPLDVNALVGKAIKDKLKEALGDKLYTSITNSLTRASRIYQSASNVIWNLRSIGDSTLDLLEIAANNTGKIGNALKLSKVVDALSYSHFSENYRAGDRTRRRVQDMLENIEQVDNTVGTLYATVASVRDIQEELQQTKQAKEQFLQDIGQLSPASTPENTPIKESSDDAAASSQSPNTQRSDLSPAYASP